MNVVGAFIESGSEDFFRWAASDLSTMNLLGVGSSAREVIELCERQQPDVILVGPRCAPQLSAVQEYFSHNGLDQPLFIGVSPLIGEYSHVEMRHHGVHAEITMNQLTDARWAAAVDIARQPRDAASSISIVTVFPTSLPKETLTSLLSSQTEFIFGTDCRSLEEMARAIINERPNLVLLGHQHIADVVVLRETLRAAGIAEPHWVLMLSHLDTSTLMSAAIAGIEHLITSENFAPAEQLAERLHQCAHGSPSYDSPLSKVRRHLTVANDDDDRNILRLLVSGATNAEIAVQVFLSEQTVKNRLSRMMKVASVSNRTEMALLFANAAIPTTLDR